jgi:hypothetical protein
MFLDGWQGSKLESIQMRYVWLAIIAVTVVPLVYVAWLANPLLLVLFGVDWWRDRIARLYPYRWQLLLLMVVCATSVAIYEVTYT